MSEKKHAETLELSSPSTDGSYDVDGVLETEVEKQATQLSRTTTKHSAIDPNREPPDGGLEAWLKVFGCFLLYSNIWCVT